MNKIELKPIGLIHTDYKEKSNMPIQAGNPNSSDGRIEILNEFKEGIKDLEGFSHIILLYYFDRATKTRLSVIPFMDDTERGIFATRSPIRPNHIGLSIVEIKSIENNEIIVKNIDVMDGTPLLDIKPYIKNIDSIEVNSMGWLDKKHDEMKSRKSDNRFD